MTFVYPLAARFRQRSGRFFLSLQAYLNPNVLEPDTWNETYPNLPFTLKVDYNAKRLAVTSINHSGWGATLTAARSNPYADFLHWELTPAHVINDVCDGYAGHDEGLGEGNWNLDAAPLPHPWCTCLWYVDTNKTLDEVAKELRAWEDGESNPRLDEAFGKWEKKYTKAGKSGIMNSVGMREFYRFADDEGREIYRYPGTDKIQALKSTAEISEYFSYLDAFGDKLYPIDESFSLLPLETQKELAEGIEYARQLFRLTKLPKKIVIGSSRKPGTYAVYSEGTKIITFTKSRLLREPKEAFPTMVHELFHFFEHTNGYIAEKVIKEAFQRLHIRSSTKETSKLRIEIVGYGRYEISGDDHEVLAHAIENHSRKVERNELQKIIVEIVMEMIK